MTLTTPRTRRRREAPIPRSLRRQAEEIMGQSFAFMDSDVFRSRTAERELFGEGCEPPLPNTSWYQPTWEDLQKEDAMAPQLMTGAEERLMFLRFNFSKRRLIGLQRRVRSEGLTRALAEQLVLWHRRCDFYREYLVRTNLALVLAMAKRTRLGQVDFAEIVSEGNMALLRAVEKFSVDRGFKFSTYACRAILKAFSRTAVKHVRHRTRFPVEFEPEMERSDWSERRRETIEQECIDELRNIVDRNLADLTQVERTVIQRRFNWREREAIPLTLEEVGRIVGVTKERVRQIQNKALAKIKQVMDEGVLRTSPGETPPAVPTAAELSPQDA